MPRTHAKNRMQRPILTGRGESSWRPERERQIVITRYARTLARIEEEVLDEKACQVIYVTRIAEQKGLAAEVTPEIEQRFRRLADQWRRETRYISSVNKTAMHSAYQQIIGMGQDALPLIFRELERTRGHWLWALFAITRQDPAPEGATFDEAV